MASFKLAAAALLALGTTTAFVPSFVPKSIQQSAIQTNALYSVANNQINNNAKKYSEYAIKSLVSNNGYLQKNSEILNNSINVWKYDQDMLNECKKTIPKYI